jgi:Ni,Fe-hydrogenase I small subunit
MGCKGPIAFHNCPAVRYNDGANWPVGSGHGCIGCSEPDFWELGVYNVVDIHKFSPPSLYPPAIPQEQHFDPGGAAIIGSVAGLAIGAAVTTGVTQLMKKDDGGTQEPAANPEQ